MDLTFNERELAFRDELRGWLADNKPDARPEQIDEDDAGYQWRRDWQRKMYEAGWAAPAWPSAYGGRDATLTEQAIYFEELGRARAPQAANTLGDPARRPDDDGLGQRRAEAALPRRRSCRPRRSGARASPSPTPAPTSPRSRRARCATATTASSPARRCGPAAPSTPSGACSSPAPTPTRPSTRA